MANRPFISKRAPLYADIPDEKWNNWRWQLSNRINTVEEFEKVLPLTESERKALSAQNLFRVDITPYFISLIDPDDPDDPIRKQVVPTACRAGALHGDDGRLAGRRPPLPRARAGAPLPRPGADAGHHAVRLVLPLLHPLAHRRRSLGDLLARRVRDADRLPQAHAAGARCAALRRRPAGAGAQDPGRDPQPPARDPAYRDRAHRLAACRSSCPCASPTSCAICCRNTTRCG